jgi:hypothetical protein
VFALCSCERSVELVAVALSGEYQFVAWCRSGVGALLDGDPRPGRLAIEGASAIEKIIAPNRPEDVTGLDPRAVLRTTPPAGALDFEPNLFASVELAHPGLPWMLSAAAGPGGRVTPWIALVVVEDQAGVTLRKGTGGRDVLVIEAPADPALELPDLGQAWAWAHAQTAGTPGDAIDAHDFARSRGAGRAGLVAPRRLRPDRRYLACIVPTTWTVQVPVELPVFYAWRFATGPGGDFTSLVKRLRAEPLAAEAGRRTVDVSDPGWGLAALHGLTLEIAGALRSAADLAPLRPEVAAFGEAILDQIDAAANPAPGETPLLPPPFYGAAATRAVDPAASPPWQAELNRDVRHRIAAGLGAEVVRRHQDELVDAAWRAAGEAERANQVIRQAELAAEVSASLVRRHLAPLPTSELLAVARPLLARTLAPDGARVTVAAAIRASAMPTAALSPSLVRLTRTGGRTPARSGVLVEQVHAGVFQPLPAKALTSGAAGFDAVSIASEHSARFVDAKPLAIADAAQEWQPLPTPTPRPPGPGAVAMRRRTEIPEGDRDWTPLPTSEMPDRDPVQINEFAAAARAHQAYLVEHLLRIPDRPRPSLGDLGVLRGAVETEWTPGRGILAQVRERLDVRTLGPLVVRPVLERPLIQALAALSIDHVLPGAGHIATNRVGLAVAEPTVARAVLVGANEELGRELLWRGFPGALGHTWLKRFWGRVERSGDAVRPVPDIEPIESWPPDGPSPVPGGVVLVVRGEVLHRYPNALVYAVPARWDGAHRTIGEEEVAPVFATTLGSDLALFGFDVTANEARGGDTPARPPGWYFVIAEHPSEPRFGLAAMSGGALATWHDVSWSDLADADLVGNYLRVDRPISVRPRDAGGLTWGRDAAQMAAITLRRPTRVAIHASRLLAGDE